MVWKTSPEMSLKLLTEVTDLIRAASVSWLHFEAWETKFEVTFERQRNGCFVTLVLWPEPTE